MLFHFGICATSLIVLAWSAAKLISGSSRLALQLRISPVLVGLTVIAFGTSAPELVVSINAAVKGHGALIVGNVLGSNIANASLALFLPLLLATAALVDCRSMALPLAIVTALALALLADSTFSRLDSLLLLAALPAISWLMLKAQRTEPLAATGTARQSPLRLAALILFSLVMLLVSAHFLTNSAIAIARALGIGEQLIGLTLVAIGTSLPEIAAAAAAARQRQTALVLSNLVGSNLLNLLAVMGISGVINPLSLNPDTTVRDLSALALFSAVLVLVAVYPPPPRYARTLAAVLLLGYLGYLWLAGQAEGVW